MTAEDFAMECQRVNEEDRVLSDKYEDLQAYCDGLESELKALREEHDRVRFLRLIGSVDVGWWEAWARVVDAHDRAELAS